MSNLLSAEEAMARLSTSSEVAFLDLREAGPFSEGHPLFATPCPWSGMERDITRLVPRRSAPVILIDGGNGIAQQAANALERMGYSDVSSVQGGTEGWAQAGFTLFKGVHVPSKTLGELAEEELHPRPISPDTLSAWFDEGRDFLFFDCRPASEHREMTVPGATCLPNGEIPHRLATLPPEAPIVVTCAGRTRGIVGAATLNLVAPERTVFWLEDGTQGWTLSGRHLSYGNPTSAPPDLDSASAEACRARARALLETQAIPTVTARQVGAFLEEPGRTTYLFDVRSPKEATEDRLTAFAPAPVVTLVQATDRFMAVRRARVVVADDLGLRGAIAAYWLRALGYETYVAPISDALRALPIQDNPQYEPKRLVRISAKTALLEVALGQARFIDLRSSTDYCAGHVAGATWSIRPRIASLLDKPARIILIGNDTPKADLAGATLLAGKRHNVMVVEGGYPALVAAGATIATGPTMSLSEACDIISFAHGRHEGNRQASQTYLAWEKGLVAQLSAEERANFHL